MVHFLWNSWFLVLISLMPPPHLGIFGPHVTFRVCCVRHSLSEEPIFDRFICSYAINELKNVFTTGIWLFPLKIWLFMCWCVLRSLFLGLPILRSNPNTDWARRLELLGYVAGDLRFVLFLCFAFRALESPVSQSTRKQERSSHARYTNTF